MTGKKNKTFSYRVVLEYDGRDYHGWQKQSVQKIPTIQNTLEQAVSLAIRQDEVYTKASGRTDAGVHALGQVVRIDLPIQIPASNLKKAVNDLLPKHISIRSSEVCKNDFCPQRNATSKEYRYYFTGNENRASFIQQRYIQDIKSGFDIKLMKQACQILIGEHDFSHYYCEGTPVSSHIRKIFECELLEQSDYQQFISNHYMLRIVGSGFMKQMVRLLMGAIWDIGYGKLKLEDFKISLHEPKQIQKRHLAALAPANGLMLYRVYYDA